MSALLSPTLLSLYACRFGELPIFCGNDGQPGVDEVHKWRDYTDRPTTGDQLCIENYLDETYNGGESVLHVGIGNSLFAKRFSTKFASIVGISITAREVENAASLRIDNYFPILMNKYGWVFAESFSCQFDIIVDNNPSTFACCYFHFVRMVSAYRKAMRQNGKLITNAVGLGRVSSAAEANARWSFNFDDWSAVTEKFGLVTSRANETVFVSIDPMIAGPEGGPSSDMQRYEG